MLFNAIAAFGAGTQAAAMGGVNAFIMTGIIAIVGGFAQCCGLAAASGLYGTVAFGTIFGPHISFAGGVAAAAYARKIGKLDNGCNLGLGLASLGEPSVLAVGGIFGVIGWVIGTYLVPFVFGGLIPIGTDNPGNASWHHTGIISAYATMTAINAGLGDVGVIVMALACGLGAGILCNFENCMFNTNVESHIDGEGFSICLMTIVVNAIALVL